MIQAMHKSQHDIPIDGPYFQMRFDVDASAIKFTEVKYCEKSFTSSQGCSLAKYPITRSNKAEKFLVLFKERFSNAI